jgi:ComF family protein
VFSCAIWPQRAESVSVPSAAKCCDAIDLLGGRFVGVSCSVPFVFIGQWQAVAHFEAHPYTLRHLEAGKGRFRRFCRMRIATAPVSRCVFTSQAPLLDATQTRHSGVRPPGADDSGATSRWHSVARALRHYIDTRVESFSGSVVSAVFPAGCALCQTPLPSLSRVPVCAPCWASLTAQTGALCLQCGEALGAHPFATADRAPGDWLCRPCRVSPPAFDRAVAFGLYQGTLRALIHLFKYDRMAPIAGPLGAHMARQIAALPGIPQRMTVVPVPLFRGKQRQRGFNQAALLAEAVARYGRAQGLDLRVAAKVLRRTRSTQSQAELSPVARRRNVRGAFAVPKTAAKQLAAAPVLLIDDILTTGATARAASAALRRAGATEIWVATAARAQRMDVVNAVDAGAMRMEEDVAHWDERDLPQRDVLGRDLLGRGVSRSMEARASAVANRTGRT